jgi:hypothetical protein
VVKRFEITYYSDYDPTGEYGDDFSPWSYEVIEAESEGAARAIAEQRPIVTGDGAAIHSITEKT